MASAFWMDLASRQPSITRTQINQATEGGAHPVRHERLVLRLDAGVLARGPPVERIRKDHDDAVWICEPEVLKLLPLREIHEVLAVADDVERFRRWRSHLANNNGTLRLSFEEA